MFRFILCLAFWTTHSNYFSPYSPSSSCCFSSSSWHPPWPTLLASSFGEPWSRDHMHCTQGSPGCPSSRWRWWWWSSWCSSALGRWRRLLLGLVHGLLWLQRSSHGQEWMIFLTMGSLDLVESSGQSQIDLNMRRNCLMMGKLGLKKVDAQCLSLRLKMMLTFVSYWILRPILLLSSLTNLNMK